MRFYPKTLSLILLLVVLSALSQSCTATIGGPQQAWIVSGQTLDAVGKQFLETGRMYDSFLEAKAISPEEYRTWAVFANKFKLVYPAAVNSWQAATNAQQAGNATDAIIALKNELLQFYLLAMQKKGGA